MANKFWVGGSGTWDTSLTGHWAATTGGASGVAAPTASDDVFIDANSGGGTISISGAVCRSMDCTNAPATTISGASTITIGTSTVIAANIALKLVANITTGASTNYTFVSTSATQQTVDFAGKTVAVVQHTGAGSSYLYSNGFTSGSFTHTAGTLDFNGKTFQTSTFTSSGATTRTVTYGAATHTCIGNYTISGSNVTVSAASSTITLTLTSVVFAGLAKSFGTVQHTGTTLGLASMTGANTFVNLKFQPVTGAKQDSMSFDSDITVTGTLTSVAPGRTSQILLYSSTVGTVRTFTVGTAFSITNTDFMDITAAGAAGTWSGTMVGDAGGNSNITFTTAQPQFWIGGTGSQSDATKYSQSSGGANNGRIPLPQDNLTYDANSGAGTATVDMPRWGKNITMTNSTITTFTMSVFAILGHSLFGNLTLNSTATYNFNVDIVALRGRGAQTITSNAGSIAMSTFALSIISPGGSYTLQDAMILTGTTGGVVVSVGTFDTNNQTLTTPTLTATGAFTRSLLMGTSTINLSSTSATTVLNVTNTGTLTVSSINCTIVISTVSANTRTFTGGAGVSTYGTLTYTVAGSTGTLLISDSNTFGTINFSDATNARILQFGNGTTTTVTVFNVNGTSGKLMSLNSVTPGTAHNLSKATGIVGCDFLSVKDSQAAGGATWYAGVNSTNVSGNTGWLFVAAIYPASTMSMMGV